MAAFEHEGEVRWSETDASGRFHYANALMWAENAEHALYKLIDPAFDLASMPRRAVSASFLRPFACGDRYTVRLWVGKLGNSSIGFVWQVLDGEAVATEGKHTAVHVGRDGKPKPLPDRVRVGLDSHLANEIA